eukprot:gene1446-4606_t
MQSPVRTEFTPTRVQGNHVEVEVEVEAEGAEVEAEVEVEVEVEAEAEAGSGRETYTHVWVGGVRTRGLGTCGFSSWCFSSYYSSPFVSCGLFAELGTDPRSTDSEFGAFIIICKKQTTKTVSYLHPILTTSLVALEGTI